MGYVSTWMGDRFGVPLFGDSRLVIHLLHGCEVVIDFKDTFWNKVPYVESMNVVSFLYEKPLKSY